MGAHYHEVMHTYISGALLMVCAACGSVGDQIADGALASDGSVADGGAAIDAAIEVDGNGDVPDAELDAAGVACDVTKPFGPPELLVGVNSSNHELWGFLSGDELTLYFNDFSANTNLFVATRSSPTAGFSPAMVMSGVNSPTTDERPAVTADGLILIADTATFATGTADIGLATRASTAQDFGPLLQVTGINTPNYHEHHAFISADGLTLLFGSDRNFGDFAPFQATRTSTATAFGPATYLVELDAFGTDSGPVLSADGLEIFFYSNRFGGVGATDIWHATRASPSGPFDPPVLVTELSSTSTDLASWLSPDRCRILFSSDRLGSHDLWMATRPL